LYFVTVNSCDSAETTTTSTACSTSTSDLQSQSIVNKPVPLMTSTVSVMIGNAERAAADSVVVASSDADGMPRAVLTGSRQQLSLAGDGSVVLTLTMDRPPVSSAAAALTCGDVRSSTAEQPGIVTVTGSPASQRFVDYICLCWILSVFHLLN